MDFEGKILKDLIGSAKIIKTRVSQNAGINLDRIEKTFNETFAGWKGMRLGFGKYFVLKSKNEGSLAYLA